MIINLNNVVNKVVGAAKILVGNVSGDATAVDMSGQATIDNAGAVTLDNDSVIAKVLTGYSAAGYTPITATDSIITAIESLESLATSINNDYLSKSLSSGKIFIGTAGEAVERDLSLSATGGTFALSNTGVLTMPNANTTTRGLITSADWNTFNGKENSLTFSTGLTRTTNTITANLSTGVAGGQSAIGGNAASNSLTLSSTSHATKGKILFGTSAYDEANNRLGVGVASPSVAGHFYATSGEVMRIATAGFGDPKITWYDDVFELFNIQARRSSSNDVYLSSSGVDNFRINGHTAGFGYMDGVTRLSILGTGGTAFAGAYTLQVYGGASNGQAITVPNTNDARVGFGIVTPEQKVDILGIAQIRRAQDATGGGTLQPSNFFQLQSAYWTGAASASVSMKMRNDALSTTPTYKLAFYDNADVERFAIHNNGVAVFEEFTIAGGLPTASTYQAGWIMVTDETGGYVPCFSDGTNWRRVTDRAIAS